MDADKDIEIHETGTWSPCPTTSSPTFEQIDVKITHRTGKGISQYLSKCKFKDDQFSVEFCWEDVVMKWYTRFRHYDEKGVYFYERSTLRKIFEAPFVAGLGALLALGDIIDSPTEAKAFKETAKEIYDNCVGP